MKNNALIIVIALVVFMIHEFEELTFIKPWVNKHHSDPSFASHHFMRLKNINTSVISALIAEEFLLFSIFSIVSVLLDRYSFIFSFYSVYSLHLVGHIFERVTYKAYCPSFATSLLTLPVYGWILYSLAKSISIFEALVSFPLAILLIGLNFSLIGWLEPRLNNWFNHYANRGDSNT